MAVVRERREERWILGVHLISEAGQFELPDDAVLEEAGEVGRRGDTIARPDFFSDRAAANQLAFFKNQNFAACARQVSRGHQAIVAPANDNYVVFCQLSIVAPLETQKHLVPSLTCGATMRFDVAPSRSHECERGTKECVRRKCIDGGINAGL